VKNRTEMAENKRDAKPTLRPFYKQFGRGSKFGPNGIETGVHNVFFGSNPGKNKSFCCEFWVPENEKYALSCLKLDGNGRKRPTRKAHPSAIL